ncbi:MAG: murein transglycosylase domain-containing protein [Candidatus Cloacimonetes bacterium]|nr:murein transglycosylase domain-containing protein [Candidatus Cloacimonadota bacterium]MCF7814638.1 murein transglycosylase domain-containing protein [Candidatus Cloacimonadota bacterium]MCF7869105.1 murein transglycosylase domain-containing protein [Candidatus Cloacimonadota bacterium]MCF7884532.1 murein transglycosylase domain-containing protein [Candidatus Cloacimonadota bacterium]
MKKLFFTILMLGLIYLVAAQDSFEDFKQQEEASREQYMQEQAQAEANYYNQQDSLFTQYKEEIERLWNEFKESTPKEWVSYNSDFSGRSSVDFEEDQIQVEAVLEQEETPDQPQQEEKAKEIIKEQVKSILEEKDKITNKPILKDQVTTSNNEVIEEDEIEKAAEEIVEETKVTTFKNKDGKTMVKYQINLSLVPNHLKKRIEGYRPTIEKLCKKYDVDKSLALAIIHSESYFNPKAYNRFGNAYGMMQIVPKYAGLTMNNYIYKRNQPPTSDQLFNPEINLEMGIGYLRWLADNKWDKVANKTNRMYCVISSYNGGPGSIYKAMTGRMTKIGDKWEPMFVDLSTIDSRELFNKLKREIPFEETRKYIVTVTDNMNKFYSD